jgi:flagellar protein FliO/FliZ
MSQTLSLILVFLLVLIALPFGIRWIQRRGLVGVGGVGVASRVISAIAVGPQQRVVTVEVGPVGNKTWLVLGVTPQAITPLHTVPANSQQDSANSTSVLV